MSYEVLLANVRADYEALNQSVMSDSNTGDPTTGGAGSDPLGPDSPILEFLEDLKEAIDNLIEALGGGDDDSGSGDPVSASPDEPDAIAGSGRIWGDPHFIGADGGKYDIQGEAGKTYNLLSDQNFQMNGTFDAWKRPGTTVVGEVGINTGSDQIEVNKDGTVMVNGAELERGDRVELNDGGYVEYGSSGVTVESGEWKVDFQFAGGGNHKYLNIDVTTENAIADGVKPHGLLGQTFDGDGEARNGDAGKGMQGGGAIEGADGMTERGDTTSVQLYEVDSIHDRNFTEFNQFFDEAEADPDAFAIQLTGMVADAFASIEETMDELMDMLDDLEIA